MPGPLIQAPKGALLPGDPLVFGSIGLPRPMADWVALHERAPFGIPDSFRAPISARSVSGAMQLAELSNRRGSAGAMPCGRKILRPCGIGRWSSFHGCPAKRAVLMIVASVRRWAFHTERLEKLLNPGE